MKNISFALFGVVLFSAVACAPSSGSESNKFSHECVEGSESMTCETAKKTSNSEAGKRKGDLFDQDGDGKFGAYCKGTEVKPTVSTGTLYNQYMARSMIEKLVDEEEEKLAKAGEKSLGFVVKCETTRSEGYECKAYKNYEREGWDKETIKTTAVRDEVSKAEALAKAQERVAELKEQGVEATLIGPSILPERDRKANDRAPSIAVATIHFPGCND